MLCLGISVLRCAAGMPLDIFGAGAITPANPRARVAGLVSLMHDSGLFRG